MLQAFLRPNVYMAIFTFHFYLDTFCSGPAANLLPFVPSYVNTAVFTFGDFLALGSFLTTWLQHVNYGFGYFGLLDPGGPPSVLDFGILATTR